MMTVQPAAFLRTTLPLGIDMAAQYDSGRYHSIWLPDHMVSFWPDSIWTPEFTDLALTSPSPHRHLDGMAVSAAAAVLTKNVPLATCVIDTVRRHPSLLAQSALTMTKQHLPYRRRRVNGSPNRHSAERVPDLHLGEEEYGVEILRVQEIRGYEAVTHIANARISSRASSTCVADRPNRGHAHQVRHEQSRV
jgi:hypothetical protein